MREAGRGVRSPALAGRGGSVSRRDLIPKTKERAHLSWVRKFGARIKPIPSRSSGGSAREGKDSHSRQWRLSMAVFLNRNKRPQAAPIEVAELLSEKPPPSQPPRPFHLFGRGPGGGASRREAASPGVLPRPHSISSNSNRFCSHVSQRGSHWAAAGFSFWRVPADAGLARAKPC